MIKCLIEEGRLIAIVLVAKKRATSSPLTFRGGKKRDYGSSGGGEPASRQKS